LLSYVSASQAADIGGTLLMPKRRSGSFFDIILRVGHIMLMVAVSACSHAQAVINPSAPELAAGSAPSSAANPAPEAAVTREKASTACWMKYEKEGRALSLDQRLPLVEKCTADKLKAAGH
jgi:hypothetical protein